MERLHSFSWYGGKYTHLDLILPILPKGHHFCDVFGGAASVVLNSRDYKIRTYNDLDSELVSFFRVLRDNPQELIRIILLTPYSREEFDDARGVGEGLSELERARRFYVRIVQSYNSKPVVTRGDWSYKTGVSSTPSPDRQTRSDLIQGRLLSVSRELLKIQIENSPALEVIRRFDSEGTVFYLDPPYLHTTRVVGGTKKYVYEMSNEDHVELIELLRSVRGLVVLSGYRSDLYDDVLSDWIRLDDLEKTMTGGSRSGTTTLRRESVWCNFEPVRKRKVGFWK